MKDRIRNWYGDVDAIQDMLHDYLWDSISVRDTAVRTNMKENFYHGLVLGLLRRQRNWLVQSNAETGNTRKGSGTGA